MEAKAHANPYPDFTDSPHLFLNNGSILETLLQKTDKLLDCMVKELRQVLESSSCHGEYSVYTGYCGVAMLIMMAAIRRNDSDLMNLALTKCQQAVDNCKNKRACFLNGDAGPITLCSVMHHLRGDSQSAKDYAKRLLKMVDRVLDDKNMPDEMLYGRAGFLHALLLANKHLGDEVIPPSSVRTVVEKILQSGRCKSKSRRNSYPLGYEWHDKNYLGAAHGVAGILYVILLADKVLTEYELNELIRPTIDWLLNNQRYESGNFASSEGSDRDRLVQWCHGAPGFVHLLLTAYQVYGDKKYLDAALDCGEVIWRRGLLTKGYSLCHGVAGNAYSFLQLYKVTKDPLHWHRAACFADWCTHYPRNQGLQPDRPFSLYEGKAGMAYFLIDFKDPINSSFPGFDL